MRKVDHNASGLAVAGGDTLVVYCLAGDTSEPFADGNQNRTLVVFDEYLPGWTVGQAGIFDLGARQGQWVPLEF